MIYIGSILNSKSENIVSEVRNAKNRLSKKVLLELGGNTVHQKRRFLGNFPGGGGVKTCLKKSTHIEVQVEGGFIP